MTNFLETVGHLKVRVTRAGVALFNARFPCSTLRDTRAYWFQFAEDGDLIDTDVPEQDDGEAAEALAEDAKNWILYDETPEWYPGD